MKKWLRRITLTAGLVLAIGGIFLFLRPNDPISEANFARIKEGMTENEVVAILRGPATEVWWFGGPGGNDVPQEQKSWTGQGTAIYIDFDNGRVIDKQWFVFDPPSALSQLEFRVAGYGIPANTTVC